MKIYILFIALLFVKICGSCFAAEKYSHLAYKIIEEHSNQQRKMGFTLFGSGGSWTTDFKTISLDYISKLELDVPKARKLYIQSVQDLIERFNSNREVRPFLHDYPFTYNNIDITLNFYIRDPKSGKYRDSYVSMLKGKVFYDVHRDQKPGYDTFYEEPYEEAVRLVQMENLLRAPENKNSK